MSVDVQSDKKRLVLIQVVFSGVMAALVTVATFLVQIPNPATKGYINFGDIMIFVSALIFGPVVGGLAGSIGSALADVMSGYGYYAPFTFVVKGLEGVLAGLISNGKSGRRNLVAVTVAGAEMVVGYFLAEYFFAEFLGLQYGWTAALTEVPGNVSQIVVGGLVGVPIAVIVLRRVPESWKKLRP